ncbi:CBU_0592 family membrane protein [Curtobacterium luteum]|uniref:CBU_0592 family membrane protein n=1 Tax=Curtobacterium luteum TaxID=33881 RepID=UPI003FD803FC
MGCSSSCPESRVLYGIVEFLGWFGAVTVLAGYILFSTGKLQNGPTYQLLNLVGGLAIAVNVGAHHAIPSLIVNGVWAIVAVVVLTKMLRARRAAKRGEPVDATAPQVLVEPPTTTAVLPVVGPALRDHDAAPESATTAEAEQIPVAPAPMTETVPVITATIALALVAAAQQEHAQQEQQQHAQQEQQQQHGRQEQQQHLTRQEQ